MGLDGWSTEELQDLLRRVNEKRQNTEYKDSDYPETKKYSASGKKEDITIESNPFVVSFEVGVNYDGYWTHTHMRRQLEDVTDVLHELHSEGDIIYWFDHSSSHNKLLEDGLNATKMGVNPKMRETTIVDGCLGGFDPNVSIGERQSIFQTERQEKVFTRKSWRQ